MTRTETIAKLCHEINKIYCESLGDFSQNSWEDAPQWQRDSCVDGINFFMDNPNVTPEDSHLNWCKTKLNDGWKYGETKDAEKKTHPCLIDYEDLPEAQRFKDKIYVTILKTLLG